MDKPVLTKEQAEAIEHALQEVDEYKGNPDKLLRHASMKNVYFRNELHPLDSIDTVNLAKALYIGYEVKPEFKVGDWVTYKDGSNFNGYYKSKVEQITSVRARDAFYNNDCCVTGIDKIRHATPEEIKQEKERRWWKKHGRDVWELKKGDVLINLQLDELREVQHVDSNYIRLKNVNGIVINTKGRYKVACFAENRLDVSVDE